MWLDVQIRSKILEVSFAVGNRAVTVLREIKRERERERETAIEISHFRYIFVLFL